MQQGRIIVTTLLQTWILLSAGGTRKTYGRYNAVALNCFNVCKFMHYCTYDLLAFLRYDLLAFLRYDLLAFLRYDLLAFLRYDLLAFLRYDLLALMRRIVLVKYIFLYLYS